MNYGGKECEVERIVYDPSLVLYLPLWKRDGTSIQSDDAYGHTCTVTNATWGVQGRTFDGTDDNINCGKAASLNALTGNMTVEAWINPTSLGENNDGRVFDKGKMQISVAATERAQFVIVVGVAKSAVAAHNSVPFGSWTHVVGVFNGINVLIYTNLTLVTGAATAGPIDGHSASDFLIGDLPVSSRCFDGLIGEVRVYNRALNPQEIQRNYLATKYRYR